MIQFFELSAICWSTVISLSIYRVGIWAASGGKDKFDEKLRLLSIYAVGFPFLFTMVPFFLGEYGNADLWCWIEEKYSSSRLYFYYIPLWMAIVFNGCICWNLQRSNKLRWYPLLMIAIYTPATIDRIQNMVYPRQPIISLQILHVLCTSLNGFFNGVAFGSTFMRAWCAREGERAALIST